MRLMTLDMRLLTLVPNHLSTQKVNKNQAPYHTRIRHYSLLFTHLTTLHNKNHTRNGGTEGKRVAARGKKVKRGADDHRRREKRGVEKVREVHIDTNP